MVFKKHYRVILAIIGSLMLFGVFKYSTIVYSLDTLVRMDIGEPDLAQLRDGYYKGVYDDGRWTSVVEVLVLEGEMVEVVFQETIRDADPTSDIIARRVLEHQSLDVDTVSGATASSNAYLKAIENAVEYRVSEE